MYCSDLRRTARTAAIAFGDRGLPILHDRRLRECDYGSLTRRPTAEIEALRDASVLQPFPGGESYAQATARIAAWLDEIRRVEVDGTLVAVGHRATYYAFEHLLRGRPLREAVLAPWEWRPGWTYDLRK